VRKPLNWRVEKGFCLQIFGVKGAGGLRRLGKVLHLSPMTGNLIVKAQVTPRIGEKVYNGELRLIGFVFDVFGPVSSPYVAVKPRSSLSRLPKTVFLPEAKGRSRRKGR